MNYYVALGVPANADPDTIRSAFRALARRYHPDAGAGSSPEKFHQIKEAYETLSDPARRLAYDRSLGAHRPVMVHVEPMSARPWRPEPFAAPYPPRPQFVSAFDVAFDELVRSFEELAQNGPRPREAGKAALPNRAFLVCMAPPGQRARRARGLCAFEEDLFFGPWFRRW